MVIGICILELNLPGVRSLKEKRGILKSTMARLHQLFNVSCAEVALHEAWQSASVGIAVVTTAAAHAEAVLENVSGWVEHNRPDIEIVGEATEIMHWHSAE
ncbi:MAG: DUF503 domain-containing protein [Anaerolineae bacterium]|nr:DUF503 domain-containing protein [Anaerolineae bacterium]